MPMLGDEHGRRTPQGGLNAVASQRDQLKSLCEATVHDIRKWTDQIISKSDDGEVLDAARNLQVVAGHVEQTVSKPPEDVGVYRVDSVRSELKQLRSEYRSELKDLDENGQRTGYIHTTGKISGISEAIEVFENAE